MKKITALFFSLVIATGALAQKAAQGDGLLDGYFTIGTGLSVPVGSFGSSSSVNPNAYGAKNTVNIDVSYTARFSNFFGMAMVGRSLSVGHVITNTQGYFNGNDPNYMWSGEATPNKLKMAMAGLYATVPLSGDKNLWLFFKPMLGAGFVGQTSTTYNLIAREPNYNNGTVKVTTSGQSYAFAYSFVLGIKYNITPLFAFMAQVDYTSTNPMFNAQSVNATTYHIYYQDATPYYLRMQMLNFNIGVGLKIH
ncbi:MAG TPA: hypothetical protein VK835_02615 [Bacteroidia bacterium]|nr:hypothetical protein [Bacteroidia bacterium]